MWARYFRVAGLRSFWGIDLEWCSARGSIFRSFSASNGHALFKFVMWRLKSTGACHASARVVRRRAGFRRAVCAPHVWSYVVRLLEAVPT